MLGNSAKTLVHSANPPSKPLLIYDGNCNFCKYWVNRWQRITGGAMDYLPLQDPQLATRFPEIPRAEFEKAVHFIETSGAVYSAAEAVFRSLAKNSKWRWPLRWYKKSRAFAGFAETAYRFVARHREFFSWLSGTRD